MLDKKGMLLKKENETNQCKLLLRKNRKCHQASIPGLDQLGGSLQLILFVVNYVHLICHRQLSHRDKCSVVLHTSFSVKNKNIQQICLILLCICHVFAQHAIE